ncbi:uncharacterized protein MONOS_3782 [Monocercomonoides exilis]|uniref:uncharacterized protein n=1 Tax=Monocercomonoides exilis TaxID=2049356 RepID=UPI0035595C41|nr:hypothetical protein MONOS_3782 [Monocercomonoides exilis]|eukprot:MONOS_3782.1-p1 / transcript=MONOS_3782.1 / gene=MONOS_3782 / organism=Monocercomonoides_exilis_PA203 / gene_product=unspecified product / transcript_product=unspecified product / location=Mono_scaffold00092:78982-84900(+) / protein_length=1848 / sequence_SO=supercontig / SO=protein_coding / is_pseudo=false
MKDDIKSRSSISSGMSIGYSQSEGLNKLETILFSIFSPLYDQPKHTSRKWEIFVWTVTMLQMMTISLFRIDIPAQSVNHFSYYMCFLDGTSIGLVAGKMNSYVIMGCSGYLILLDSYLLVVAAFQGVIAGTQPWKYGGLMSSSSGLWKGVDSCIVFGCVFAMRMLYGWPFWRGAVTIGSSLAMAVYFVCVQPIYKLEGNLLMGAKWCMFGCLRLFGEVGYAVERATRNWIGTVVFQAVGLIGGIVVCAVVLPTIGRKTREKKYLLLAFGSQVSETSSDNPSLPLTLPSLKRPERIESSLRFVQKEEYQTMAHLTFADYVYTQGLKTNKSSSMLCFQYASFLSAYRKNHMKASMLIRKARTLSPSLFLSFVLFCKAKENGGRAGGENSQNGASELNSFAFTSLLAKAEKHHEMAVSAMKDFFENVTAIQPDYKSIPVHLNLIVKNEEIARKSYEELISSHGQNTAVLRSYARLLLDIYNDEDEAEMILNRADRIEEESTSVSETTMTQTHTAATTSTDTLPDFPLGAVDTEYMGSKKSERSKKTGAEGEANTECESHSVRVAMHRRFEVQTGRGDERTSTQRGLEGKLGASQSLSEMANLERSEAQLQKALNDTEKNKRESERKRKSERKKKKKKKKRKDMMIIDLMMGGRNKSMSGGAGLGIMKCAVVSLHLVGIAALAVGLVVYVVMSNAYQNNLDTLRNVCDLSYHTARSAAIGYNFFVYDVKYKFANQTVVDEWMTTMVRKAQLLEMLRETSESLASMLGRVHETTSNMDPWETADVDTYVFIFTTKNETQADGSTEEVVDTKKQILHPTSMIDILSTLSQMIHHLSISDMAARPEYPDYLPSMQYLVFNCPVPILDGAKRVIMSYFELMNTDCDKIVAVFVLIIVLFLGPLTAGQLVMFVKVTKTAVENRERALHAMLDVPKNKMQSVIRRLLRADDVDSEDCFSVTALLRENEDSKRSESCGSNRDEQWEEAGSLLLEEGKDESMQCSHRKRSKQCSVQPLHLAEEKLTDSSSSSASSLPGVQMMNTSQQQKEKCLPVLSLSEGELGVTGSSPSMLPGAEPMDESNIDTSPSYSSSKSLFGEQTSTALTFGASHFVSPRMGEESAKGTQKYEPHFESPKSPRSMPSDIMHSLSKSKSGCDGATGELPSYLSRNDALLVEHQNFKTSVNGNVGQEMGFEKSAEEEGILTADIKKLTSIGSALKSQPVPLFDGRGYSLLPMRKQHMNTNSQGVDLTSDAQSIQFLPALSTGSRYSNGCGIGSTNVDGNGSQFHSAASANGLFSTQSSSMEYENSPAFSTMQLLSPAASPVLFRQSQMSSNEQSGLLPETVPLAPAQPVIVAYSKAEHVHRSSNEHLAQKAQVQLKGMSEAKYSLDEEDTEEAEKSRQMGLIRNAVEDAAWEEGMEKEMEKLEAAYKQLPSPVTPTILVTTVLSAVLGVVTIGTTIALVCIFVNSFKPTSANIILSGMRASILFQIQYLLLTVLQPLALLKTDQSVTFATSHNPILNSSSHCSGSPAVSRDLLVPMSRYFEAVHLGCHFGDSKYSHSGDYTYDSVSVKRMNTAINRDMLLKEAKCYLADSDDCSEADPFRMYGVKGTIYGLTTLLARLRVNLERISKMDVEDVNVMNADARFALTALRSDIVAGMNKMTNMILATGKEEVQESITILTVAVVCFCVLYFVSMFGNGMRWIGEIGFVENVSSKLFELLPTREGEKEVEFLQSMATGQGSFDRGREAVMDAVQQLLVCVKQNEHFELVTSAFYQLTSTVEKVFGEEEKEMAERSYVGAEKHQKEHTLIRQRLTLIGDQLRSKNEVAKAVGRRKLSSLFDIHFSDEDITFAEAAFGLN